MHYPLLARATVLHALSSPNEAFPTFDYPDLLPQAPIWQEKRACFVSIKFASGDLRGCMGTIIPTRKNLGEEIKFNAMQSAFHDPRFKPIKIDELLDLTFSVDVLSEITPVQALGELDPKKWGIIISQGELRGLLLPNLDGVNTVEQQVLIASQKAGITQLRNITLEKFSVTRYKE